MEAKLAAPVFLARPAAAVVDPLVEEVAKQKAEECTNHAGEAHGSRADVVHEIWRSMEDWFDGRSDADGPGEIDHGGKTNE